MFFRITFDSSHPCCVDYDREVDVDAVHDVNADDVPAFRFAEDEHAGLQGASDDSVDDGDEADGDIKRTKTVTSDVPTLVRCAHQLLSILIKSLKN